METGERIRAIRTEKGLTQKELGERCGMVDSAIRRYESGRGNPTQKTLIKIAKALGVHLRDLTDFSLAEEFDRRYPDMGEKVSSFTAVSKYLEEMGYAFDYRLLNTPNEENADGEFILSKDGHTAIFTQTEFEELQNGAKEAIEGRFYKKLVEQQNK